MRAAHVSDVEDLNRRARRELQRRDHLCPDDAVIAGRDVVVRPVKS